MNIWSILKHAAVGVFENAVPGGSAIVDVVNGFLPDDEKLGKGATTSDIEKAVNSLPPEQRAELMKMDFQVDIEELKQRGDSLRSMLDAEVRSKRTTRPFIAKWSFIFVAIFSGAVGGAVAASFCYAVYKQDAEMVEAIQDAWPFVLALLGSVTGTFAMLLKAYFGILSKEQEAKLGAMTGNYKAGAFESVIKAIRK